MWGGIRSEDEAHWQTAYAYVDTFVAYNVRRVCAMMQTPSPSRTPVDVTLDMTLNMTSKVAVKAAAAAAAEASEDGATEQNDCAQAIALLERRRAEHPMLLWDDEAFGRQTAVSATAAVN